MSWDWSFEVDVLGAVVIVQLPAYEGVQVVVKWLDGFVDLFQIVLEGGRLVPRAPVRPSVSMAYT